MISPQSHVDPSARLGKNVTIMPFAYIDADVEIGDDTVIYPFASIMHGTRIGHDCQVYQGAVIGADPQDFRWKGQKTYCHIGDRVVLRENVLINRSIYEGKSTYVGDDTFIMAKSHLGHDAHIEGKAVLGNGVVIAGGTRVDSCVIMSSGAMLHEGCRIGRWSLIKGGCRIGSNVPPFVIMAHNPAAYFGINAYIMHRNGDFTDEEIDNAAKAYRHIYQSGTSVTNALRRISIDVEPGRVRDAIVNFINDVDLKIAAIPKDLE